MLIKTLYFKDFNPKFYLRRIKQIHVDWYPTLEWLNLRRGQLKTSNKVTIINRNLLFFSFKISFLLRVTTLHTPRMVLVLSYWYIFLKLFHSHYYMDIKCHNEDIPCVGKYLLVQETFCLSNFKVVGQRFRAEREEVTWVGAPLRRPAREAHWSSVAQLNGSRGHDIILL